jgi:hypothetical protein
MFRLQNGSEKFAERRSVAKSLSRINCILPVTGQRQARIQRVGGKGGVTG